MTGSREFTGIGRCKELAKQVACQPAQTVTSCGSRLAGERKLTKFVSRLSYPVHPNRALVWRKSSSCYPL